MASATWVTDHKNLLIEVAAIGAGVLTGLACTAATCGTGAVACMVAASAIVNLAKDAAQGTIDNWGDALGSLGTGALQGLGGAVGGAVSAKVAAMAAKGLGGLAQGVAGKFLVGAIAGGAEDAATQLVTTGTIDPTSVAYSAALGGVTGAKGGSRAKCGHSFTPTTQVLLADGTTKPIDQIQPGDKVTTTNPTTGTTAVGTVTTHHTNQDTKLTNITLTITPDSGEGGGDDGGRDTNSDGGNAETTTSAETTSADQVRTAAVGHTATTTTQTATDSETNTNDQTTTSWTGLTTTASALATTLALAATLATGTITTTLQTTQNHPIWDQTTDAWVNASQLTPGHTLHTTNNTLVTISGITNYDAPTGGAEMQDLTVVPAHTYYVIAGDEAVLVHNCNSEIGTQVDYFDTDDDLLNAVQNERINAKDRGGNWGAASLDDGSIITARSGPGKNRHAEVNLLELAGNRRITDLYTERAPCANRCQGLLGDVTVRWSFAWNGADAASTKVIRAQSNSNLGSAVKELLGFG